MTRAAKLHEDAAERTSGELQAALTALTHRVEALEAARAHGVSRLPASAQTDPRDLPLKVRPCRDASRMPLSWRFTMLAGTSAVAQPCNMKCTHP